MAKFSKVFFLAYLLIFLNAFCVIPVNAESQTYVPLQKIGDKVTDITFDGKGDTFSKYINDMYKLLVGVAGVLAVLMIMWGGIEYMSTDAIGGKEEAKGRINNALLGLMLALGSFLILKTVNSSFLKTNLNVDVANTEKLRISGSVLGSTPSGDPGGTAGDGGYDFVADGEELSPQLTAYSPQKVGHKVEGGYASSKAGLDGKNVVRTLDDVSSGKSTYVTLAGDPSQYGQAYMIPSITYKDSTGATKTLTNITGYVHDTGSAFEGKGKTKFDVAVGRDYVSNGPILNSQPFLVGGTKLLHSSKSN